MNPTINIRQHSQATPEISSFLSQHSQHKLYHLPKWHQVVEEVFGHKTTYLVASKNMNIGAIVPITHFHSKLFGNMGISLPYINYGGVATSDAECQTTLLNNLEQIRSEAELKLIELRMDYAVETELPCRQHKVTFHLELPNNPEELLKSFKAKLRSQIRRPTKDGMYARVGGVELLDTFYKAFSINMRDLGTPVLPRKFFEIILERFPENAFIATVFTKDNQVAAASFLIRYGDIMEIPWASSVRAYNRSSPNMLLYWRSLQLAIDLGCKVFDFGRCTPGEGTYRFKKQWGATEKPLFWYYVLPENDTLPNMNPQNPKLQFFIKAWQRLPVFITNLIGPPIIKHIP